VWRVYQFAPGAVAADAKPAAAHPHAFAGGEALAGAHDPRCLHTRDVRHRRMLQEGATPYRAIDVSDRGGLHFDDGAARRGTRRVDLVKARRLAQRMD